MLKKNTAGKTRMLLILYAGTNILYTFGNGDKVLQTLCIAATGIIAVILCLTIYKNKKQSSNAKSRYTVFYCGITVLVAFGLSKFVGNIVTSILIITITALYIRFLVDKKSG